MSSHSSHDTLSPSQTLHIHGSCLMHSLTPDRHPTGIHSLPVELLARIFVLGSYIAQNNDESPFLLKPDPSYNAADPTSFAVAVSHVSQHWRQVSLHTHVLWNTLHFREVSHISRARTFIARASRSASYVLNILVETVAEEDHAPGVTLYREEISTIFELIIPHVSRWRAFHLKICDNECKGQARRFLGSCGPAPRLETLQLYHFENYLTSQRLYLATYRPPVAVFSNTLPCLKHVSLIGVNLQWATSPYLKNLHNLELALHLDNIRPPYQWWDRMLRSSPHLKNLCLHYSGPREATGDPNLAWKGVGEKIRLEELEELRLTDLDPDYLCNLMERLAAPNVRRLELELPDQDFTDFVDLLTKGPSEDQGGIEHARMSPVPNINSLQFLTVHALECGVEAWNNFLYACSGLQGLEVDFSRVGSQFWDIFTEQSIKKKLLLPGLKSFKLSGILGEQVALALKKRDETFQDQPLATERWIVRWSEKQQGKDIELDKLVKAGIWTSTLVGRTIIIDTFYDEEDEDYELEEQEGDEEDTVVEN
ncbi:hypothetical protein CVT24_004518 [Panaeolus cyanescens]|uniref:Uncharacterized protein n=1 Tax=Panaeolus cyanescens TaxID=181874 RepID=A0A409YBR5_9AGAR|nr:hypothetical protein CVT24_004518 [Panaeolus cyanescens]